MLFNHRDQSFEVSAGDRIAQIVLERIALPEVQGVDQLPDTQRGDKGFGSTGSSVCATTHRERCPLYHIHAVAAEELSLQPNVDTAHDTVSPFEVEVIDCTCQEETASDVGSEDIGSEGTVFTCTSQPPDCFAGGCGYEREYESSPHPGLQSPSSTQQLRNRAPPPTDILCFVTPGMTLTSPEAKEVQYLVRRLRYHDRLTRMQRMVARKRSAHRRLHSRCQ